MKTTLFLLAAALTTRLPAATTIDAAHNMAHAENAGWIDWTGNATNGAVIGEYVCSGYIYSANVGWICLGSGAPTNRVQYSNLSSNDFGVNVDSAGNLRGCAYGANIGWINFEAAGAPKVDLATGILRGSAYSANCGWISLSNAVSYVRTASIAPGADSDGDHLPDAWEMIHLGGLATTADADPDADGQPNLEEYRAGTNPNDRNDNLRITRMVRNNIAPGENTLEWTSVPTRSYVVQDRASFDATNAWNDLVHAGYGVNGASVAATNVSGFYRIRAYRPLGP